MKHQNIYVLFHCSVSLHALLHKGQKYDGKSNQKLNKPNEGSAEIISQKLVFKWVNHYPELRSANMSIWWTVWINAHRRKERFYTSVVLMSLLSRPLWWGWQKSRASTIKIPGKEEGKRVHYWRFKEIVHPKIQTHMMLFFCGAQQWPGFRYRGM